MSRSTILRGGHLHRQNMRVGIATHVHGFQYLLLVLPETIVLNAHSAHIQAHASVKVS